MSREWEAKKQIEKNILQKRHVIKGLVVQNTPSKFLKLNNKKTNNLI